MLRRGLHNIARRQCQQSSLLGQGNRFDTTTKSPLLAKYALSQCQWMSTDADREAATPLRLKLPDEYDSSTILAWFKTPGDLINSGDEVCEVDTDVVTYDFQSDKTGYLVHIFKETGSSDLDPGATIAWLAEEKSEIAELELLAKKEAAAEAAPAPKAKEEPAAASDAANEEEEPASDVEDDELTMWFKDLGTDLTQYIPAFRSDGFDSVEALLTVEESDLVSLGVRKGHRRLILKKIVAQLPEEEAGTDKDQEQGKATEADQPPPSSEKI